MKKNIIKIATGVLTLSLVLTACGGKKPKDAIAKIGKEYVSAEEVNKLYESTAKQYEAYGMVIDESTDEGKEQANEIRLSALDNMVKSKALLKAAKDAGIKVKDDEIDTELEKITQQVGSKENLEEAVKNMGLTMDEFKKNNVEPNIYINKLVEKQVEENSPSDKELEKKLPLYNAEHILYSTMDETGQAITDDAVKEKVKAEAQALVDEINAGTVSFDDKFKEISENTEGVKTSGDTKLVAEKLDDFIGEDMVKEFTEGIKDMKAGDVKAELIESQFGYHIVKLNNKTEKLEDVDKDIVKNLKSKIGAAAFQGKQEEFINDQVEKAKVEYFDKDGKTVDDAKKAIESFDFTKSTEKKDDKETKATDKQEEKSTDKTQDSTDVTEDSTDSTENK